MDIYKEIVMKYRSELIKFCISHMNRGVEAAEDVVHEVFLTLCQKKEINFEEQAIIEQQKKDMFQKLSDNLNKIFLDIEQTKTRSIFKKNENYFYRKSHSHIQRINI